MYTGEYLFKGLLIDSMVKKSWRGVVVRLDRRGMLKLGRYNISLRLKRKSDLTSRLKRVARTPRGLAHWDFKRRRDTTVQHCNSKPRVENMASQLDKLTLEYCFSVSE